MAVGRTELPKAPTYVPEDSQETMPPPEWGSLLSIADGSLNLISVCDLDQEVLKKLMAEYHGLSLRHLKKRSEYCSVTSTSGESYDDQETQAFFPPVADTDHHLSEIATSIPSMNLEVLTLKHRAFLAHLLMEEVDLEPTRDTSHHHGVFSVRASDGPTSKVPGAKPSPNNMPVSQHDVQTQQQVLWAKAKGLERRTRLNLLKRTWKTSI